MNTTTAIVKKLKARTFISSHLSTKTIALINLFLEENNLLYLVNGSDTKIGIEQYNKSVYPDAVVICEKPAFYQNRKDTITNPLVVVEVLSGSTKTTTQPSNTSITAPFQVSKSTYWYIKTASMYRFMPNNPMPLLFCMPFKNARCLSNGFTEG